jgi:hypothetical protein
MSGQSPDTAHGSHGALTYRGWRRSVLDGRLPPCRGIQCARVGRGEVRQPHPRPVAAAARCGTRCNRDEPTSEMALPSAARGAPCARKTRGARRLGRPNFLPHLSAAREPRVIQEDQRQRLFQRLSCVSVTRQDVATLIGFLIVDFIVGAYFLGDDATRGDAQDDPRCRG